MKDRLSCKVINIRKKKARLIYVTIFQKINHREEFKGQKEYFQSCFDAQDF